MQQFAKTKFFKVVVIAGLLLLLIFINPKNFLAPVRSVVSTLFLPFKKISYSFSVSYRNTVDFIGSIGDLKDENRKLINENMELLAKNAMLNEVENENTVLREQLDLLPRSKYVLLASNVVSQDPDGAGNWLEIDKGSNDGIQVGMSVIVSKSVLIGRVQEVNRNSAKVVLLTNPKSIINAVTSENGAKGVIKGEFGLNIIFDMILQTDSINVGDNVVSAGAGGDVPGGLFIGTVQNIHNSDDNLFQRAVVVSPLQISKLQMVFVIEEGK